MAAPPQPSLRVLCPPVPRYCANCQPRNQERPGGRFGNGTHLGYVEGEIVEVSGGVGAKAGPTEENGYLVEAEVAGAIHLGDAVDCNDEAGRTDGHGKEMPAAGAQNVSGGILLTEAAVRVGANATANRHVTGGIKVLDAGVPITGGIS